MFLFLTFKPYLYNQEPIGATNFKLNRLDSKSLMKDFNNKNDFKQITSLDHFFDSTSYVGSFVETVVDAYGLFRPIYDKFRVYTIWENNSGSFRLKSEVNFAKLKLYIELDL